MISGEELKYRNGLAGFLDLGIGLPCPQFVTGRCICSDRAACGGLDADTRKALSRSGPVQPEGRQLGIGVRLTRIWKGREVTVVVEEKGFRWEDQLFPSLSAAATMIAGTRWNGPRFFGLRDS